MHQSFGDTDERSDIISWLSIDEGCTDGGFGSGVLAPVIKDVPYLNKILPDSVTEEVSTEDSQYAYTNLDDAINRIKELEIELADAQNSANSDADYITQLEEKAKELDTYKQNEADFEKEKEKWYEVFCEIVLFPDLCCSMCYVFAAYRSVGDKRVESSQT